MSFAGQMLMKRITVLFSVLVVAAIAVSCRQQPPEKWAAAQEGVIYADASVDRTVGTIGDPIRYAIKVKYRADLTVTFPPIADDVGGLSVKDSGEKPAKRSGGYLQAERWYRLQTMTPGSYIIPPAAIAYVDPQKTPGEIKTSQLYVEIRSSIKEGEKAEDIRDIKMPVSLPENIARILAAIGLALGALGGAAAAVWYIRERRRRREAMKPPRPAYEIALEELEALRRMALVGQGKVKEYYIMLSDIVRRYIERRFAIKAKEQTTQEFLSGVAHDAALSDDAKKIIAEFLAACDMVKFAKYGAAPSEADDAFGLAREFVEKTADRKILSNVQ